MDGDVIALADKMPTTRFCVSVLHKEGMAIKRGGEFYGILERDKLFPRAEPGLVSGFWFPGCLCLNRVDRFKPLFKHHNNQNVGMCASPLYSF